eukprot:TRINITY_DN14089_c0_g1_i1.p1 TRINITY_DN14089_c0_g1~~TRINITY_DN14089_c0_g1_i1.p1  ORF type:complete len:273 (-),score=107.11 TRINITY_DN14089_c0_g1_i1:107-880(-)
MAPSPNTPSCMTVKADYQGDVRRFTEPYTVSFGELAKRIVGTFHLTRDALLKYTDDDGDLVTLASDADLREALRAMAAAGGTTLRVHVLDASQSVSTATGIVANVPVSANVATNAPETVVPVVASPVTTTPISDVTTVAESPASGNVVTAVPVADNVTNVVTLDGSPITTNVVNVSGVDVNIGNGNVDAQAQVFPFVNVANLNTFMPYLVQMQQMGLKDARRHIELLNAYNGDYIKVLSHLMHERNARSHTLQHAQQ